MDLALNNLQCLICHKVKPNHTKTKPELFEFFPEPFIAFNPSNSTGK